MAGRPSYWDSLALRVHLGSTEFQISVATSVLNILWLLSIQNVLSLIVLHTREWTGKSTWKHECVSVFARASYPESAAGGGRPAAPCSPCSPDARSSVGLQKTCTSPAHLWTPAADDKYHLKAWWWGVASLAPSPPPLDMFCYYSPPPYSAPTRLFCYSFFSSPPTLPVSIFTPIRTQVS